MPSPDTEERRTRTSSRLPALLRGGGVIAVAMAVLNIATYGYTVAAAHLIGPAPFGAFSALMGLVMVVNVLSLGLQATGARRIAADPDHVLTVERAVLSVTFRAAAALALLCLLAAPLLNALLRLDSLATAALLAAVAAPLSITGGQAGVLQGERRWGALSLIYLTQGLGRLVCGLALLLIWRTEFAAFLGVAIGAWLPVLVGTLALRRRRSVDSLGEHGRGDVISEVFRNSQALAGFFVLSNADILIARATLPEDQAGLYAGGLILVKAVLFLPQFLVIIAFPAMSTRGATRATLAKTLALTFTLGGCCLIGVALLPGLALIFVGGNDFADLRDQLWLFAIVGTLLSMIQLLIYSVLARQQLGASLMIWTAFAAVVGLAMLVDSVTGLVVLVSVVDAVLLVALVTAAWLRTPSVKAASGS